MQDGLHTLAHSDLACTRPAPVRAVLHWRRRGLTFQGVLHLCLWTSLLAFGRCCTAPSAWSELRGAYSLAWYASGPACNEAASRTQQRWHRGISCSNTAVTAGGGSGLVAVAAMALPYYPKTPGPMPKNGVKSRTKVEHRKRCRAADPSSTATRPSTCSLKRERQHSSLRVAGASQGPASADGSED